VCAELGGADLREAVLKRADLRGANLDGARLDGALLEGARLGTRGAEELKSILSERTVTAPPPMSALLTARWERIEIDGAVVERPR
jgi:uncharacterized protein YjbI with pentapeptide repeats